MIVYAFRVFVRFLRRHRMLLPLGSSALLAAMCLDALSSSRAQTPENQTVLSVRIDDLKTSQDDLKTMVVALTAKVADTSDRVNQMQGMLIGFGGFACLLQVLNALVQIRKGPKSED